MNFLTTNKKLKLAVIAFSIFLLSTTVAYAATTWSQTGTFSLGQSAITVTTPGGQVPDFGQVSPSSTVTRSYTVTNTGNTHVTVSGTLTAAGCTGSLNTVEGGLDAGQSYTFIATFSTFTASGTYTITFTAT